MAGIFGLSAPKGPFTIEIPVDPDSTVYWVEYDEAEGSSYLYFSTKAKRDAYVLEAAKELYEYRTWAHGTPFAKFMKREFPTGQSKMRDLIKIPEIR